MIGVIGGSGLYEFISDPEQRHVETPYGSPSAPISVGEIAGQEVAFLPRHGESHQFPPHKVNYRANMWALRTVGVRRILAPCAVGSLQPELGPGDLVLPDQLVDRTTSRPNTFMDEGAGHVGFADPYCPALRSSMADSDASIRTEGTMVVIEGPRFSTRAESQWYAQQGWSLVNMTGLPEASLARELAMCYASIALVTDRDAGIADEEAVNQAEVFAEFKRNLDKMRNLLTKTIPALSPAQDGCQCAAALEGINLPFVLPGVE